MSFLAPDWQNLRTRQDADNLVQIMRRVVAPRFRALAGAEGAVGEASRAMPYHGGPEPLDLAATLERYLARPGLAAESLMVSRKMERGLSLLVLLDTSLSLAGPARAAVAVAGAVLARQAAMGRLALLAFHSQVERLVGFGQRVKPLAAAYKVLAAPFGGATDLAKALGEGARELAALGRGGAHTVLITDAEHTAGPDPLLAARAHQSLHLVLVGKRNLELARGLARAGRGTCRQVLELNDLPGALLALTGRLAGRRA